MHNIVLYISIYFFLRLHVLCNISPINNDRKYVISAILISVLIFVGWSAGLFNIGYRYRYRYRYTDLYSQLICYMFIKKKS